MASFKEISKLITDMNLTAGSGRPSRNSQGICGTWLQPTMPTTPLPETPVNIASALHTPVTTLPDRSTPSQGNNTSVIDTSSTNTPMPMPTPAQDRHHQVEVFTPCTRQYNRFVDPQGRPLQPGTIIFCNDPPFILSANGKIYNYIGGHMKQLYAADPREHKFLVNEANSPGTKTNILGPVLSMLPGFCKKQNSTTHNSNKIEEHTAATPDTSTIDTASTIDNRNNGKAEKEGNDIHLNTIETIAENEVFLNNLTHQKDNLRYSRFPYKSKSIRRDT